MRKLVFALLGSVVVAGALNAQTNPENQKFKLNIHAVKPVVALGSDVDIEIELTNTSDHPLTFEFGRSGNVATGYRYDVRDEQGEAVPKVAHHDPLEPSRPPGRSGKGEIQSGKSIGEAARISDVFQFDHPGKYTIQVSRVVPSSPTIRSNIITVTVLPRNESAEPKEIAVPRL
jgi:hypothetical protein